MNNNLLKLKFLPNIIVVTLLSAVLAACHGDKGDDLDKFMATAANDMGKTVEPLPEVLPYTPLQYNADGILSDPLKHAKRPTKRVRYSPIPIAQKRR